MGIRIAFTDANALVARCAITDARIATGGPGFDDLAIVPSGNWTPLPIAVAEEFRASSDDAPATVIELARILPDWPESRAGTDPGLIAESRAQFLAFTDSQPGQATTTIDEATGRRIGLHLDNFDKLPLNSRAASRRRLGVNLGPGVRHLLVGTLDILDICQGVGVHPSYCPHTDDIRRHVTDGRPLRMLRLRLDPGDGYIAPTELIPHDGATLTAVAPSRIAFWLGHWPVGMIQTLI
jgi:hypothetical protein